MPLLADRVRETTTTTGQGTLTLAGAPSGFRTFSGAFGNGASVYYVIAGPSEWEIGIGTTGAGTLSRDTVLVSSAGGTTKVTFSAGTKDVFCSYVADRAVTTSDATTLTNKTIDDYTNNVGANSTHFRIKAGATLAKGDVVKASGFTPGEAAIEVVKTASATDVAIGIVEQALSTGEFGTAVVIGELFNVNTNGLSVGATLYQNGAGGYTTTKPSSGLYQALGWVVRANLNNGVIAVNVVAPLYVETSTNTANTSVLRDGSGNFAAGTITAALTGNASTATALQTARTINGVSFNGTADITVTAAAGTLSGTTLASGVTASSLTSVGTLTSLTVSGSSGLQATFQGTSQGAIRIRGASAGYQIFSNAAGTLSFYDDNSAATRWTMNGNGHLLAGADATYDIGASGANRPRNVYTSADAFIAGVRVGRGASNVATNTVVGNGAFNNASNTSLYNTVIGVSAGASINTSGDARNTLVGSLTGFAITTGTNNTFVGMQSAQAMTTGFNNTGLGLSALASATTGSENTGIGYSAGSTITTGSKNTLLGAYNGNQDGIDLRTANNNIVLSDGDGNARLYYDGASNFWAFRNGGTERMRVKSGGQVRFVPLATAPTTNVEDGDVYYDSGTNKLRVRAGGAWTDLH